MSKFWLFLGPHLKGFLIWHQCDFMHFAPSGPVQCQPALPERVWQVILYDPTPQNLLCHLPPFHVIYPHAERVKTLRKAEQSIHCLLMHTSGDAALLSQAKLWNGRKIVPTYV